MEYLTLMQMTDDLKYLQRLNFLSFGKLFYAGNNDMGYVETKWNFFKENPLRYIWTSGPKTLRIMAHYIAAAKNNYDTHPDTILQDVAFAIEADRKKNGDDE